MIETRLAQTCRWERTDIEAVVLKCALASQSKISRYFIVIHLHIFCKRGKYSLKLVLSLQCSIAPLHGHMWNECKMRVNHRSTRSYLPILSSPPSLFENCNHHLSKNVLLSELRKRFFTLTLWHTWQATDAQQRTWTNWNIFDSIPFSLPCSTSLKVYVPITYFSHLQCWFLWQRLYVEWLAQQGICAHSIFLATTIRKIIFLKNWHQAFKISAFSIAVAVASCFSRNHCSVFSLLLILLFFI